MLPLSLRFCRWGGLFVGVALLGACTRTGTTEKPAGLSPSAPSAPPAPVATAPGPVAAETVPSAPDPKAAISGTITLPAARRGNVKPGETIFLIARRAGGPPGPGSMLAVQRLAAGDFPMPFMLSERDSMIPGIPFQGPISITVRVDNDGDAMTRRKGDVVGTASNLKVGASDVVIALDTLQTEDQVLGGGPGGAPPGEQPAGAPFSHGAAPPLPPGHP